MDKEQIVVIGFGWVGQANALAFLQEGYTVSFFDIANPVLHYQDAWVSSYNKITRLTSATEHDSPYTTYLVCVGDYFDAQSKIQNITAITAALTMLKGVAGTVILRSTVLQHALKDLAFDMYMPEFLHEKYAVEECRKPELIFLGIKNKERPIPGSVDRLKKQANRVFCGTPEEASYVKYLSNIWNAIRIAFTNEFGDAMAVVGGMKQEQIEKVLHTILESKSYQRYGKGFGGHCLPKDVQAFVAAHPHHTTIMQAAWEENKKHNEREKQLSETLSEVFSRWEP